MSIGDLDTSPFSCMCMCMYVRANTARVTSWFHCVYSAQNSAFTGMMLSAEMPPASSNESITDGLFEFMAIFAISYHVATD